MIHDNSEFSLVYLKSAGLFESSMKSKELLIVKTVLGSCISVTMFHPHTKIAVMCHAVLPVCLEKNYCKISCKEPYKYVNCVISEMASKFLKYGIDPGDIEVKLFGGADMFFLKTEREKLQSVGRQNIEAAIKAVKSENLKLKVADVGGNFGRKLFFYTHTGEVWLKYLK